MKKNRALFVVLLLFASMLIPAAAACGIAEETTTTAAGTETTVAANDAAAAADAAIAAVTKSANIETPQTLKAGSLQAGFDPSFPPLEFLRGKEEYQGFDIDLCTAIAKKLGLQLEVVPTAWDGIIPALANDGFDIIMSAMSITPERLQQVDFTDAYLPVVLAIGTPVNAPITDKAGLAGKIVGVQVDTVAQSEVEGAGVKELRAYPTILEAFQALAAGDVQAVVNDEPASAYILDNDPDLKDKFANTGTIETGSGYGYAVKKGSGALLAAINTALKELRADGVYQKICDKWGLAGN